MVHYVVLPACSEKNWLSGRYRNSIKCCILGENPLIDLADFMDGNNVCIAEENR